MNHQTITLKNVEKGDYVYNEAINTLRTNIQFCGSNIKHVMFTSSLPNEGKSDISFSVAHSLAQIGKKVLLIDADIRKSVLISRYCPNRIISGLSQYLSGQRLLDEIIYDVEGCDNFSMIFAGPNSPNPAALLEEELFDDIFTKMGQLYDYIIVDTPPMLSLIDGAIVARHCDGAVIVIESGAVSYRLEQKVQEQLKMTGCRILGVVLNKVDTSQNGYYGKYGRYGKYGKYGRYGRYGQYEYGRRMEQAGKAAK